MAIQLNVTVTAASCSLKCGEFRGQEVVELGIEALD